MHYKIVFLFSGQGSHYRGMGQRLYEHNTVFRESIEQSNGIVHQYLHRSLVDELYSTKQQLFDDLLITHPAIVAVEIAMYRVLQDIGIRPYYVLGNSLGEFASAVANGIWSEQAALNAAIQQAKIITEEVDEGGGMLAVIHHRTNELRQLYNKYNLFLASDNFEGHFTLTGLSKDLDAFQTELLNKDTQFLRLPVTYPFHSLFIDKGYQQFEYYMSNTEPLCKPNRGFISGIEYKEINSLPDNYFWKVISQYTNFIEVVKYIESKGPCFYIDLGPSGTGATFVKYNLSPLSSSGVFKIMTPFKREVEQIKRLQEMFSKIFV